MNAAWGAAGVVVAAMFALAGAIYTTKAGGKASPYDALADRVLKLEGRLQVIESENENLKTLRANDQTEIAGLKRRVAGMIDDRDSLVSYLVIVRNWVAGGAKPPAPTIPRHLADVLPEWDLDDAHAAALATNAEESHG